MFTTPALGTQPGFVAIKQLVAHCSQSPEPLGRGRGIRATCMNQEARLKEGAAFAANAELEALLLKGVALLLIASKQSKPEKMLLPKSRV